MIQKLAPRLRAALDFLWANLPAVPWENVPDHLKGAVCRCLNHRWARNVEIGGVLHVELLAAGAAALGDDRDWDSAKQSEGPPLEITTELRGRQAAVFDYLWRHGPCTTNDLWTAVWGEKAIQPGTVTKCIARLQQKLEWLRSPYIIDRGNGVVRLAKGSGHI